MKCIKYHIDPEYGEVHQETPELKLIRAMIERAIVDAIHPDRMRDKRVSAVFKSERAQRYKEVKALRREWKASKLRAKEFAASRGLDYGVLMRDLRWFSFIARDSNYGTRDHPSAYEWIWDKSMAAWSFLWCLSFFFADPNGLAEKIRKFILISREHIAWE